MSIHFVDVDFWNIIAIWVDDRWKLVRDDITDSHGEGGVWLGHKIGMCI